MHIHRGQSAVFWRSVPCGDAIKNVTELVSTPTVPGGMGLGDGAPKAQSIPDRDVP